MSSAVVTEADVRATVARWDFAPSELGDHGRRCCSDARSWFRMMDRSAACDRAAPAAPSWFMTQWKWGPGKWPLHWCEAMKLEDLDCGALASLARESLTNRGIPHATVQLVQLYTAEECEHWTRGWDEAGGDTNWIAPPLVYHEAVMLRRPATSEIGLWDPSRGRWMDAPEGLSHGANIALKLWPQEGVDLEATYGGAVARPFEWVTVPEAFQGEEVDDAEADATPTRIPQSRKRAA